MSKIKKNKIKKPAKVKHLANWYFGTFCYRCGRMDRTEDKYARECYDKLHLISDKLMKQGKNFMTHMDFRILIRDGSTFCRPIKREFHKCQICAAMGIKQRW